MEQSFEGFGGRVQKILDENGLKQADLASLSGLSRTAISQYITGKRMPDSISAYKISQVLNVSMDWLVSGKITTGTTILSSNENRIIEKIRSGLIPLFDEEVDFSNDVSPLDKRENELIQYYRLLSDIDKEDIYDIIKMKYARKKAKERLLGNTIS